MTSSVRPRFFALATAALLAGCAADSSVSTSSTPVDLNQVFSEMRLPAVAGATSAAGGTQGFTAAVSRGLPSACSYAVTTQSFVCAPITAGGITIAQTYTLLNSSGSPLSVFDAKALEAVRVQNTISGTQSASGDTFTIDGKEDQTLSGLQTSKHTLNGTSTINMSGTFGTGTANAQPLTLSLKSTTKDLVISANPGPNSYPASGTITLNQTMSLRGSSSPFTTTMVLTFDGTSKVKVTIDGISALGCSTIDLASATPTCR